MNPNRDFFMQGYSKAREQFYRIFTNFYSTVTATRVTLRIKRVKGSASFKAREGSYGVFFVLK